GYSPDREVHKVSNLVKKGLDQLPELSEEGVVSIHSDLPKVRINTQNGRLLFYHLLSNASKFRDSERPLAIKIGAARHNGLKCLYVKDNGIGINPQYQDKIFKIFQRLHTTMEYPGTGIGLAICKKVIQEEGGQIWLSSEEGKGATFYFTMQFD
ncbi:MAG: cyanobacterial phytochrome A, partial [Phaeodactylibacter sp.]|nr:cyanobacterial phytochrome A [Phaeodactylibacter sp.]